MVGDIILGIKNFFKQEILCIHEYEEKTILANVEITYKECKKCGKVK